MFEIVYFRRHFLTIRSNPIVFLTENTKVIVIIHDSKNIEIHRWLSCRSKQFETIGTIRDYRKHAFLLSFLRELRSRLPPFFPSINPFPFLRLRSKTSNLYVCLHRSVWFTTEANTVGWNACRMIQEMRGFDQRFIIYSWNLRCSGGLLNKFYNLYSGSNFLSSKS